MKGLYYSFGSLDDIFSVDFITKFFLSVLQKYSLSERNHNELLWSKINKTVLECTTQFLPAVHAQ